jgi:hypothetical protein
MWSLGNNFYVLLVGLFPFFREMHSSEVGKHVKLGNAQPYISKTFRHGSPGEQHMVKLIKETWDRDPLKRIDVFSVVRRLRTAIQDQIEFEASHNQSHPPTRHLDILLRGLSNNTASTMVW